VHSITENFTTIDEEEKIGEYLKYRPRPFKAKDIVKDTLDYIGSQGVSLDSDTREALEKILGGRLTSGEITSGRDSDTRDEEDKASRSTGELEFENNPAFQRLYIGIGLRSTVRLERRVAARKVGYRWRQNSYRKP
jgi:hypothetical protein